MDGESILLKFRTLTLATPATALALILGFISSAPAQADVLLLAAGGGGGSGYCCGLPGGAGQAVGDGGNGVGVNGGLGGANGGGGQAGTGGFGDGAGGAGWSGVGGSPSVSSGVAPSGGGLSSPSFAGGVGAALSSQIPGAATPSEGDNSGGFGGGGGGGYNSGGGGGGYSGGGGGGGGQGNVNGGGGGGSYIASGFTSMSASSGVNGAANANGNGLNGYIVIDNVTYGYTGAVETFVAATSGTYSFDVFGAQGGSGGDPSAGNGGCGAEARGDLYLSAGTRLELLVGGGGLSGLGFTDGCGPECSSLWAGGGGGGSFVWEVTPGPHAGAGLAGLVALALAGLCARGRRA